MLYSFMCLIRFYILELHNKWLLLILSNLYFAFSVTVFVVLSYFSLELKKKDDPCISIERHIVSVLNSPWGNAACVNMNE